MSSKSKLPNWAAELYRLIIKIPTTPEEVKEAEEYLENNPVELPEKLRDPMKVLERRNNHE